LVARQEQRPIIDDAIGLHSLQAAVDIAEKGVVVDHHRAKDGFDLRLVLEDRCVIAP
jgi:c-di-AMP phosphodiesterase-like protein